MTILLTCDSINAVTRVSSLVAHTGAVHSTWTGVTQVHLSVTQVIPRHS